MKPILTFLLAVLFCAGLSAQTSVVARISGTIQDPTGLSVPEAQITVTQVNTGLVRTTQSGPDGAYVLPSF